MGTCSVDGCRKKDFEGGLCTVHRKKAPVAAAPVYGLVIGRSKGALDPNPQFLARSQLSTPNEPYQQRIAYLLSCGPANGGEELVHSVSCLHDTQDANNVSVWYSWNGNTMTVWGLGGHAGGDGAGNDKYQMLWFDGTNKNWDRRKKKGKK